jgi:hypothetical protein
MTKQYVRPSLDIDEVYKTLERMTEGTTISAGRIQAAERLLSYKASAEVKACAKEFLVAIFEDRNEQADLRLYAIQVLRKCESASEPIDLTPEQKVERIEAWRWYEIWDLKRVIVQLTGQMPPFGFASDLLSPDYLPPPGNDWPPVVVQRSWFTVIGDE